MLWYLSLWCVKMMVSKEMFQEQLVSNQFHLKQKGTWILSGATCKGNCFIKMHNWIPAGSRWLECKTTCSQFHKSSVLFQLPHPEVQSSQPHLSQKKAQQQQLSRLELQCSTILTCYSISIRRMHYVSQTTSACRLNLASPLYSLPNTWIIKMLISATQNGTLLLYCEFDAQCLWCKHFLASVISMSEGQFRRTVFVREGKPTNVKDSST